MSSALFPHPPTLEDKVVELSGFSEMTPEEVLIRTTRFAQRPGYIRDVLVIGLDGEGTPFFSISGGMTQAEAVFLLEKIKLDMLMGVLTFDSQTGVDDDDPFDPNDPDDGEPLPKTGTND